MSLTDTITAPPTVQIPNNKPDDIQLDDPTESDNSSTNSEKYYKLDQNWDVFVSLMLLPDSVLQKCQQIKQVEPVKSSSDEAIGMTLQTRIKAQSAGSRPLQNVSRPKSYTSMLNSESEDNSSPKPKKKPKTHPSIEPSSARLHSQRIIAKDRIKISDTTEGDGSGTTSSNTASDTTKDDPYNADTEPELVEPEEPKPKKGELDVKHHGLKRPKRI